MPAAPHHAAHMAFEVIEGGGPEIPDGPRFTIGLRLLRLCRWPLVLVAVILGPAHPHSHIAREIADALERIT